MVSSTPIDSLKNRAPRGWLCARVAIRVVRRSTYRADTEVAVSMGKRSRAVLVPSVRLRLRAKQRELRKDFHHSFWYTEGRNLFLISSPSRTHLQSSLPVTVFAFARKNGLLVWRVAPELTSVETMEDGAVASQLSRDAGTEHCSRLPSRNGYFGQRRKEQVFSAS